MKDRPRIFLGPVETAGYFAHLRAGLRQIGIPTTFVDLNNHHFQHGAADRSFWTTLLMHALRAQRQTPRWAIVRRALWFGLSHLLRMAAEPLDALPQAAAGLSDGENARHTARSDGNKPQAATA